MASRPPATQPGLPNPAPHRMVSPESAVQHDPTDGIAEASRPPVTRQHGTTAHIRCMVSQNVPSGSDLHPCAKCCLLTDHGIAGASHLCHDRTSVELTDIVRRMGLSLLLRSTHRCCEEGLSLLLRGSRRCCEGEGLSLSLRGTNRQCEEEGLRCNPSSTEVHSDAAEELAEDARKRAGVQSLFLRCTRGRRRGSRRS